MQKYIRWDPAHEEKVLKKLNTRAQEAYNKWMSDIRVYTIIYIRTERLYRCRRTNSLRRRPRSLHTATAGKKVSHALVNLVRGIILIIEVSHALVNLVRVCRRKKRRTQRNLKSPMVLVEGGGDPIDIVKFFVTAATVLKAMLNLQTASQAQTLRLSTSSQSTGHSKISFVTRNCRICSHLMLYGTMQR
ncbi:uncharacterized protein LOC127261964 [Andrographis paniculata]|uniref:uncharacterized protein LOC127261964 n=1 Tax=Andrographis paniculata TaxID=175694 RepID=UPI0021E6DE2C|nr:uncharacterized protein LOC127261964 [Andrographis paniculata]